MQKQRAQSPAQENAGADTRATNPVFKPRLSRLDRLYTYTPVCFLTACTFGRRTLLANIGVHETFVRYAQEGGNRGVLNGCYALMPDHLHLFAAFTPASRSLSEWIKGLKAVIARHPKRTSVSPPFWQERFFDQVMGSAESHGASVVLPETRAFEPECRRLPLRFPVFARQGPRTPNAMLLKTHIEKMSAFRQATIFMKTSKLNRQCQDVPQTKEVIDFLEQAPEARKSGPRSEIRRPESRIGKFQGRGFVARQGRFRMPDSEFRIPTSAAEFRFRTSRAECRVPTSNAEFQISSSQCQGSCEEIPERAKASRAETQRRRVDKENKSVIYFEPLRLCVSARDG